MALYSPTQPRPRRRPPLALWPTLKRIAIGWAGVCGLGLFMAIMDGALPDRAACGRIALTALLCTLLYGLSRRWRPDNKPLRALAAAAIGLPLGVAALGIIVPHEPWPPSVEVALVFAAMFAFGMACSLLRFD